MAPGKFPGTTSDNLCRTGRTLAQLVVCVFLSACGLGPSVVSDSELPTDYAGFQFPTVVVIAGYDDHAMEPFISRDGHFLFFNNSNDPRVDTNVHVAVRSDDSHFDYRGPLEGANSSTLDGVPTMDASNMLYFVSTRNYFKFLETIHRGKFNGHALTDLKLVSGVSRQERGRLNFDVEVSEDGNTLYYAEGLFTADPFPREADLAMAFRTGDSFERQPDVMLDALNTSDLEYAAAISKDERELFFTRLHHGKLGIYRAIRHTTADPFGSVQRVAAISGHVEAPTLSPDERLLYYHRKDTDGRFRIYSVRR
jgi:WD40-like Beta Propeller Repeat